MFRMLLAAFAHISTPMPIQSVVMQMPLPERYAPQIVIMQLMAPHGKVANGATRKGKFCVSLGTCYEMVAGVVGAFSSDLRTIGLVEALGVMSASLAVALGLVPFGRAFNACLVFDRELVIVSSFGRRGGLACPSESQARC